MEKEGVTCHSWQSMKYRYHSRLAKKDVDEPTAENDPKVQEAEKQVQNPSFGLVDDTHFNVFVIL